MQNKLNDGIEFSKGDAVFRVMTNNAATSLTDGTIVCLDTSDSEGKSVGLPATLADPTVFGVVVHPKGHGYTYADQADCLVCVDGVCKVMVDGTENITAGNHISVISTTGVGNLYSSALSCTIGTALEAYTTNDDNGYINMYVRKGG